MTDEHIQYGEAPQVSPVTESDSAVARGHELFESILAKVADKLATPLTEEEIDFNRRKVASMLPSEERHKFLESQASLREGVQKKGEILRTTDAQLATIRDQIAHHREMAKLSAEANPQLVPIYEDMAKTLEAHLEFFTQQREQVAAEFRRDYDIAMEMTMKMATEMLMTKVDSNTGLQTRTAMLDQLYHDVFITGIKELEQLGKPVEAGGIPEGMSAWEKVLIGAGDMSGFRIGNDTEGHTKFDILLREKMARKFIAVSRFLGTDSDAYGDLSDEDFESKEALEETFPENTEFYDLLMQAKKEKARVVPIKYRLNAGGDETSYIVTFPEGYSKEKEELAHKLYKRMYETTLLSKHRQELLKPLREKAEAFPNQLEVDIKEFSHADRLLYEEDELNFYNQFNHELRFHLIHSGAGEQIETNPDLKIAMGATVSWVRGDQALVAFMLGRDFDGNPHTGRVPALIDAQTLQVNQEALDEYTNDLYKRLENLVKAVGITDPGFVRDFVSKAVSNDIFGNSLELLFHQVEEVLKPQEKAELVLDALTTTGNSPVKLYEVAALAHGGRLGRSELSPASRAAISQTLVDRYIPMLNQQLALPLDQRDPSLMIFYSGLRIKMLEGKIDPKFLAKLNDDPLQAEVTRLILNHGGDLEAAFKPKYSLPKRAPRQMI